MIWIIFYLIDIVLYYNKFIAGWVIINCIIAYVVKTLLKPYYKGGKGVLKTKSGEEISIEDIHNYYPEFKKHDKEVNYFSLAFAFTIYVWIRFLIWMILLAFTWLQCK